MSRQNKDQYYPKRYRKPSPQYDQHLSRIQINISEAETSQDDQRDTKYYRKKHSSNTKEEKYENQSRYKSPYHERKYYSNHSSSNYSHKYSDRKHNPSDELQKSKVIFQQIEKIQRHDDKQQQKHHKNTKIDELMTKEEIKRQANHILDQIQTYDYQKFTFDQLKQEYYRICNKHLRFVGIFPQSLDKIGNKLLQNGIFHDMWSKVFFKSKNVQKDQTIQRYYTLFHQMVKKNVSSFQKTFNPIPGQGDNQDSNPELAFKRYRHHCEQSTNSTTKMDFMILFQQVKSDMKTAQIQQNLAKQVEKSIQDFKLKTSGQQLNFNIDPNINLWFDQDYKVNQNWTQEQQKQNRQKQIQQIKKQRIRERSPLSNRFRMMHQIQSNERRMKAEMACVFLSLDKFYFFNDLHIVKIDEIIFSENQQIIVLKAYSVDFCPKIAKMKIQPKLRNLISVYKFCGLSQLVRLERTHGKFDGIIIYPESFNVKKYLTSSNDLSLLKDEYLKDVKQQIPEQFQNY